MKSDLSAKMEDYLETIAILSMDDKVARVSDIAKGIGVTKASVSQALKTLKERKLINQKRYGYVTLTEEGRKVADSVIRRHELLTHFIGNILGVASDTAAADACRIEHAVSEETLGRIAALAEFIEKTGGGGRDLAAEFARYAKGSGAGKPARRKK